MIKRHLIFLVLSSITSSICTNSAFNAVQIQPSDEKIVTGGFHDVQDNRTFLVNRYNTNGSLDLSFNEKGFIFTPIGLSAEIKDIIIQTSNERIVAGGYSFTGATVAALTRYLSTGPLDNSFGGDGIVTTIIGQGAQINALALQGDGSIVVCGTTITSGSPEIFLARYNTDGSLDSAGFGTGGIVITSIGNTSGGTSIIIQPGDGRIVITASVDNDSFAIARYNTDGTLDNAFGTSGITRTILGNYSHPFSIALQSDNKFVVAGQSANHITLIRYNSDGTIDTGFGSSGIVTTQINQDSLAHDVKINPDNTIIIGGSSDDNIVNVKYTTTGALDSTFGQDGIFILDLEKPAHIESIAIHPSTTGVASAGHRSGKGLITQLSPSGTLDCTFNDNGIVLFPTNPTTEPSYAFAASTSTQNLGTTFANIIFDINGPLKNWSHSPGGSVFTCLRSGTYLITYSAVYTAANLVDLSSISFIALQNGIEISGSQISVNLSVGIGSINVTRNIIVTVCKNDEILFQNRRSSGEGTISLQAIGFGTTPIGATITINNIT